MPEQIASKELEGLLQTPSKIETLAEGEKRKLFRQLIEKLKNPEDVNVRENTLHCLNVLSKSYKPTGKDLDVFKEESEHDFKNEMEVLINKQNGQWAKIWHFIVQLLGCETHGSKNLLNSLLAVLEKAMKSKDGRTLALALNSWSILIDNFALNPEVLAADRRIQLLTIPLKSKIAKDPMTMNAKFYTWWHLIVQLKANIGKHYEAVLKPFFLYCYGPLRKDSLPNQLNLSKLVPVLSQDLLVLLTCALGVGINEVENELQKLELTLEIPTTPIFPDPSTFESFYRDLTCAVADYLITSPDDKLTLLAFKALVYRIGQFHNYKESAWQGATSELIQVLKTCSTLSEKTEGKSTLEISVCDIILSTWDTSLLDSPILSIATTPREYLLGMMLQEHVVLQNAKTSLEKHEDRYIMLIRTLLDKPGSVVAGPEIITNIAKITEALEKPETCSPENLHVQQAKLIYMWDQLSKVIVKVLPLESANEDCNEICRKNLMSLLLCPLKLSLKHQTNNYIPNGAGLLVSWKHLFLKYAEVSALSLSMNKPDCGEEVSANMLELLTSAEVSFKVSTILTFIQFTNQLVSIHPPKAKENNFESTEEVTVVKLLVQEAMLLEIAYLEDVTKSSKASMLLAKTFQSLMIMQSTIITSLRILKGFYHILANQNTKQGAKNESIADIWQIFTHNFTNDVAHHETVESREIKGEIREHLGLLEQLKTHVNIKVVRGAVLLEGFFSEILNKPSARLSVINKQEEATTTTFAAPSQNQMSRKRPRKQSLVPNPSAAPTFLTPSTSQTRGSPTISPARSKPCLEEEDSQDFVKIAPKATKSKKVLTPHQRESKRRRRDDIPALYQGLSQDTFNSQDTQDTQDNYSLVSSGTPVASTSKVICVDEDAVDVDLLKTVSSNEASPKKRVNQVEDQDETMEEDVFLPYPFTPTKDEENVSSPGAEMAKEKVSREKLFEETKDQESDTSDVSSTSNKEKSSSNSDDDVIFVEETPITHKLGVSPNKSDKENTISENISTGTPSVEKNDSAKTTIEESQDIIEDSQMSPIKETPVVKVVSADVEIRSNKGTTVEQVKKQLKPSPSIQNRQGVTLPSKRSTKILSDSSNKEKSSSPWQSRATSGRAAQMLEMANSSISSTETKSSPNLPTTGDNPTSKDVLAFVESKLPSNTFIVPCSKVTEQVDTQAAAEKSPDKMDTALSSVSTPLSSLGKSIEKRSNLKQGKRDDGTPSPKKLKRVSFAEPVVSSEQESPKILNEESTYTSLYKRGSPISLTKARNKSPKVSRKLLLYSAVNKCDGSGSSKSLKYSMISSEAVTSQGSLTIEVPSSSDAPIFPTLLECEESIHVIAEKLSSPMLQTSIIEHLQDNNITTIGNLSSLSEISINNLSIKEPKIQTVKSVLMEYLASTSTEVSSSVEEIESRDEEMTEASPLIEEPKDDDETQTLDVQMSKLMERYSVKQVLEALGNHNEVFTHAMTLKVPQHVVAEEASAVLGKVPEHIAQQAPHTSKQSTINPPISEILKSIENPQEIIDYSITHSDPLVLIKTAAKNQNVTDVLNTLEKPEEVIDYTLENSDPMHLIKKLSEKVSVPDVLKALAKEEEVLEHSLLHVKPQNIIDKIKTQFEMSDIVEALNQDGELLKYIMTNTEPSVLIEKATANWSLSEVLGALQKPAEILNYAISSCPPKDVMQELATKHSASELLQAMDKNSDVLDHALKNAQPEAVISMLKAKVTTEKVVDALGDKDKVLEHVLAEAGPLIAMTRATNMLKEDELKVVVESLDSKLQQEMCKALPLKCVVKNIKEVLSTGSTKDKDLIANNVVHLASDNKIISEFVQRSSKLNTQALDAEQSKKILSVIPLHRLAEKISANLKKTDKESREVIDVLLQNVTSVELINKLIQNFSNKKVTLESEQFTALCNQLPLSCVVERVESALVKGESSEVTNIKDTTLPYFSASELLQHLAGMQAEESTEAEAVRTNLLALLMESTTAEYILKTAESKLKAGGSNRKTNKAIESVASHLPKYMLINILRKSELSDLEKHDLLDHLINLIPSQDTMSRLPIKDVILYYEKLLTTPDYSASLMKTSFEKASNNDIVRFLRTEKITSLIKSGSISNEEVAASVSIESLVTGLSNQLNSPTSTSVLKLLKSHFPRDKLGELVTQILTDPK